MERRGVIPLGNGACVGARTRDMHLLRIVMTPPSSSALQPPISRKVLAETRCDSSPPSPQDAQLQTALLELHTTLQPTSATCTQIVEHADPRSLPPNPLLTVSKG